MLRKDGKYPEHWGLENLAETLEDASVFIVYATTSHCKGMHLDLWMWVYMWGEVCGGGWEVCVGEEGYMTGLHTVELSSSWPWQPWEKVGEGSPKSAWDVDSEITDAHSQLNLHLICISLCLRFACCSFKGKSHGSPGLSHLSLFLGDNHLTPPLLLLTWESPA